MLGWLNDDPEKEAAPGGIAYGFKLASYKLQVALRKAVVLEKDEWRKERTNERKTVEALQPVRLQ